MTMTRRATDRAAGRHVPSAGTPGAEAVERARSAMLSDAQAAQPDAHRRRRAVRGAPPPGRGCPVRLSRRRDPAALRRPGRLPGPPPRPRPPRAGRRPRGRRLRPGHRQGRRLPGHLRPRRHEPGHRHRHRAARLHPDGRHHRQRARRADRQGRVPGDRHHRHHPADDQAQLPGAQRRRPRRASSPRRSTSPAPAGPGPVHVDITKDALHGETRAPHPGHVVDLPGFKPDVRRPSQASCARRGGDRAGPAAGHPGRPRRPPRRGASDELKAFAEKTQIPSRTRCSASAPSTRGTRCATASWACTAGSTSTGRSSRRTC